MECFTVLADEIEGRLDSFYYKPLFKEIVKKLDKIKSKKIIDIATDLKNGSTPSGGVFQQEGIPYFRSQDFNLFDFETNQFISEEFHKKLNRSMIKPNDILLAVVGATLGVVGFVPEKIKEGNINQNVVRIRVKDKEVNPQFLAIVLSSKIGQSLILRNASIQTQAYLNNSQLGNIRIPIPDQKTQDSVIALIDKAYSQKKQKETKAQQLLDSINDYVLDELGIKLPELENKMCYVVDSKNIDGAINPERYRFSISFKNQIKIKDVADIINESFVPAKKHPTKIFDWLRIDKVRDSGFLSGDSIITTEGKNISKSSVQFAKERDVLLARLGPSLANKKILIAPKTKNDLVVSNEFIVLRPKNIYPEILVHLLKSDRYLKYILSKGRGETPSRLRIDRHDFAELNFPKLDDSSLPIQNEIAEEVNKRLQKTEQLQKEAKEELVKAKQEVEKMILG